MWNMSSSYVRDCSNASGSSTSKTFIIIVNNEPGNVGLNDDLQSILATHGADPSSQVSVMQMGGGGNAAVPDISIPANSFGQIDANALPLNFTLDGFPTIPIEGVEGGYAELPLDMDALQRLESVLHTEETKEILGEPLMDDVNYPTLNQLADQLDKLNPSTDFKNYSKKKRRPPPERRSQRQMDKAEREEVEKILAENQLMLQREREELRRQQEEQQQQQQQQELEEEEEEEVEEQEEVESEEEEENYKKKNASAFKAKDEKTMTAGKGKSGKNALSTVDKGKGVTFPIKNKGSKNSLAISKAIIGKNKKNKNVNSPTVEGKGKKILPTTGSKGKGITFTTGSKGKGVTFTTGSKGKEVTSTTGSKEKGITFTTESKGKSIKPKISEPEKKFVNFDAKELTIASNENLAKDNSKESINTDEKSVYVEKLEDDYGIPKEVRMKKLSVKVKKLNEKLVLKQRKSLSRNNHSPSSDGEEQMGEQNVEDEGGDHGKRNIEPPSSSPTLDLIINRATVTTGSSSTSIEETIEKGSTSPNSLVNKNSVSNSSLSTVQTNAVSESNRNNNNNINKLDITSSKILKDILHSSDDLLTLSDKKSDLLNVNACNNDDKCESEILMPTQNFSDEANALSSQSQMDRSQANNDSSRKSRRDDINSSSSVNTQYLSQVPNKNIQSNNKVGKIVAVLTPKAKREVYELKVVMQKENQSDVEIVNTSPKKSVKTPHLMGGRMPTALTGNQLNRGSFASNKHSKCVKLKEIEKHPSSFAHKHPNSTPKLLQRTPSISKSLMNYKIPLKNSAKRPPLDHKPEHIQNPSHLAQSTIEHSPSLQIFSPILDPSPLSSLNTQKDTSMPNNFSQPNRKVILQRNNIGTPTTTTTSKKIPASFKVQNNREQDLPNTASHPQKDNEIEKLKKLKLKLKSIDLKTFKDKIRILEEPNAHVTPLKETANSRVILLKDTPDPHVTSLKRLNKNHKILPSQKPKMNTGDTKIRRSSRPVKKKSFGDDILFLDEKTAMDSDDNSSENEEEARFNAKGAQNSDSASDSEDESLDNEVEDDDPERLWCICKKPHNNRFMICCDRCEDWFHGACVGINKAMGKQMEERKIQWICPNCKKAERAIKGVTTPRKETSQGYAAVMSPEVQITNIVTKKKDKANIKPSQEAKSKFKTEHRVLVYEKETGIVLSGTAAPTINLLPYWLKAHPEYTTLKPEMTKSIEVDPKTGVKRIDLETFGLKPKSKPAEKLDKSFSFQEKIDSGSVGSAKKDKKYTVKLLNHTEVMELEKAKKIQQEKPPKTPKAEMLYSPKKKIASPSTKEKRTSIDKNEFYRRVSTDKERGFSRSDSVEDGSSFTKKALKEFIKDPALAPKKPSLKSPEIEKPSPKNDAMNIRNSVKKMLYDALEKRKSEVTKEFTDFTEEALRDLCKEIEEQLFITFNKDVGFKYKSRYRSLIFNIKDSKNGGLFRQILSRTIPPEKLAVMSSEELASKELAEWREREEKKELEAIQKHELERIALGNQYIMKSHKGEIVIDKEELVNKSKDTESVISLAPDASIVANIPSEVQEDEESINHKNHIYDPSCRICSAAMGYNEFSKEELESKEKGRDDESDKDHKSKELRGSKEEERRRSSSRRESESSSYHHHHSKHKKKEKEKKHTHKSKEKDRERDKDYHKDKERSRHRSDERRSKESEKHRSSSERERHKSSSEKERHKASSKDDKRKKEDRKRRHSGSRKEDSKRRESEDGYQRKKSEEEEKENKKIENSNQKWKKDGIVKDENGEIKKKLYEENQDAFKMKKGENYEEMQDIFKGDDYKENKFDFNTFHDENLSNDSMSPIRISNGESSLSHSPLITIPSLSFPPLPEEESFVSPPPDLPQSPIELFDRSPGTPPLPVEDELMSPATPPLPGEDEDRLTPPPSSTPAQKQASEVQIPIWKGLIFWPDVAKFSTASFEVSGKAIFFPGEVPTRIEVIGRASPDTVWSYIAQTKKSGSKEIIVIRFQPLSEEEKASYIAMYSYLASKKRFAVIGNCSKTIKDFYIVPLASHQPIPQVLLPLDGPGFEESRPHMLIGVIVRFKHRRRYDPQTETWTNIPDPLHHRIVSSQERDLLDDEEGESLSSLPSVPKKEVKTRKTSTEDEADDATFTPSPLSTEDATELPTPLPPPPPPVLEDKKNKERESMLAELNRQIERDRKEISEMQKKIDQKRDEKRNEDESGTEEDPENKDSSHGGDGGTDSFANTSLDTSKINIPSNLHEILASIKKKEEAIREKENEIKRRLNMPEEVMEDHPKDTISTSSKDVDLRLLLGSGKDQDLRVFTTGGPTTQPVDQDFRSRDPRGNPRISRDPGFQDNGSSLNNMSENDHVTKAVETERPSSDFGTQRPHNSVYGSRGPGPGPGLMPLPGGHHHQMHLPVSQDNPPNAPYPSHELPPHGYRPPGPPFSGPPTDGMPLPPYRPEHSTGPPGCPSQPLLRAPPGPAGHPPPPFGHPGPASHPGPLGHPIPPVLPGPASHAGPPPGPSFGPPIGPFEEYPARPPHEEYPGRPPHQYASRPPHEDYSGRPPHEEYPERPPHEEYKVRLPHEEYTGRPPHEEYPGRPPHEEYPGRPPHEEYPGRPPHKEYPGRPHEEYPGRPSHEGYSQQPPHEEYPPYSRSHEDRRHRGEDEGGQKGGSWERRGHRDPNWVGGNDRRWDRNDSNRWGHRNKPDRFSNDGGDRKRRWNDGGGGGPSHNRGRWGEDVEREDRNWRNDGGKRHRKDRWYENSDKESGEREIDY